jgi:hypothetical protein
MPISAYTAICHNLMQHPARDKMFWYDQTWFGGGLACTNLFAVSLNKRLRK